MSLWEILPEESRSVKTQKNVQRKSAKNVQKCLFGIVGTKQGNYIGQQGIDLKAKVNSLRLISDIIITPQLE
jgi:hypothetical protein